MPYHARLYYGGNRDLFISNWEEESIIEKILIPFFNGHIITLTDEGGKQPAINLKGSSELRIYSTKEKLNHTNGSIKEQMLSPNFEVNDCTEEIINKARTSRISSESRSILEKNLSSEKNQVFVIMKLGDDDLDSAYEVVIKPVFQELGITVIRGDEIQDSGKISDQVLENIATSKFILSELSGERPNCYYETGFAFALGKKIILTIHKRDKVHFDLSDNRFIEWNTPLELRNQLKARMNSILNEK